MMAMPKLSVLAEQPVPEHNDTVLRVHRFNVGPQ
jgi:hypothetical protein